VRVLVTGGAGFVGSHVVSLLQESGIDVRVLDVAAAPVADQVIGDITDPRVVDAALTGVDAVCHQAAKVGLGVDFGDATDYVTANDVGTATLLGGLWRRGFAGRLVLASSMVVYGEGRSRCAVHGTVRPGPRSAAALAEGRWEPECPVAGCGQPVGWAPVGEETPVEPRNVYAATKLHQEHLCTLWGREAGAAVVSLRYHNVYGPHMPRDTPYAGVASIFRSALEAGRSPQVTEDGGQTRDFVHVADVARANLLALTAPSVPSGACNVASGTPHTVLEMATALADAFGGPAPHVTGQWRVGDVRHIVASPARAADVLGFEATRSFEEGMREFAFAPIGAANR
jgi:dTDP-L-rhamnose 4-epimerase